MKTTTGCRNDLRVVLAGWARVPVTVQAVLEIAA